jgi:glycosyltransferase involved in cell wall biosynthesis
MKISVVIPFYNESPTLRKTLKSLANQTLKPFEILLVDSGSTDNSSSVIKNFIKENNINNISIYTSGEMSPSSSINLGIKKSTSDLIAYVDCDLNIPLNWLESHLKLMNETKSDIISPQIYTVGEDLIDKAFIAQTYGYYSYTPCLTGSLIKKNVIEKIGYFLPNARANYDIDFIKKLNKLDYKRVINNEISLEYFGTAYCESFTSGIIKISTYSENAWRVIGDIKPYVYIIGLLLSLVGIYLNYSIAIIGIYFTVRGYLIPLIKSSSKILIEIPLLLLLPFVGLTIDVSRIIGYLSIHKIFHVRETN